MGDEKFDLFCPECNILVETDVIAKGSGGFTSSASNPIDEADADYHGDYYYISQCKRCNQPFLIKQSLYGIPGEFETITEESVLYPAESRIPIENLPTMIKSAYDQACRSFTASLFEPCVLMCRKSLEVVCKMHDANGNNLYQKLESLKKAEHIDQRLLNWSHEIRAIANDAAHESLSNIEKEDARDCLDLTEAILLYVYSLGSRFDNFKSRRENKNA